MKSIDTNMTIRLIRISDAEDLQKNIFPHNSLDQTQETINESLEETKLKTAFHLVAEVGGTVVGNMKVKFKQNVLEQHRGKLFNVVVNPHHQKRGIAKLLLKECKKRCLENDILILETSVRSGTPAEAVYRKLGFIQHGSLPRGLKEPWGDKNTFDEILFYRDLDRNC